MGAFRWGARSQPGSFLTAVLYASAAREGTTLAFPVLPLMQSALLEPTARSGAGCTHLIWKERNQGWGCTGCGNTGRHATQRIIVLILRVGRNTAIHVLA